VTVILPQASAGTADFNEAFGVVEGLSSLGTTGSHSPDCPSSWENFVELKKAASLVFFIMENGLDIDRQLGTLSQFN